MPDRASVNRIVLITGVGTDVGLNRSRKPWLCAGIGIRYDARLLGPKWMARENEAGL
jgi:hypothetical protein